MRQIKIDPEIACLICELRPEEKQQLEDNINAEGCRDPLVAWFLPAQETSDFKLRVEGVTLGYCKTCCKEIPIDDWEPHDGVWQCPKCGYGLAPWIKVLLDGHNRMEICERLEIEYKVEELDFASREEAMDWIDRNQLGRRNLSPDQFRFILGRIYNREKRQDGGHGNQRSGDQNDTPNTAEKVAVAHGVSPATVKRAGKYAEDVDEVRRTEPEIVARGEREILARAKVIQRERKAARKVQLDNISTQEAEVIEGVYDVIVIDPPWPMKKIDRYERPNQVGFDYPTMNEEELEELELPAAEHCHFFMWTTQKYLPMAFRLLNVWGLRYVCCFVWHKPGGFQVVGLPQYNSEFVLYARNGSPEFIDTKAFSTCFNAPRGKHSVKPQEFYNTIKRVTAGRRIDMFARREIEGFDSWGNEV